MPDARVESLAAVIAARRHEPSFRRAYADLRETLACAIDPLHADRDLAWLLARYLDSKGDPVVGPRFEAVLTLLDSPLPSAGEGLGVRGPSLGKALDPRVLALLTDGLETLLREHRGLALSDVRLLDPWAGTGELAIFLAPRLKPANLFANEADPVCYTDLALGLGPGFEGLCLADSFRLPERRPTPGFEFTDDENTERIARQQATEFDVLVTDLRGAPRPDARAARRVRETFGEGTAGVRWMLDRLAPQGVIAFLSDGAFVDEPPLAGMRACLERECALVAHLALPDGPGLTFLVARASMSANRNPSGRARILYAETELSKPYATVDWTELEPTERHVWRTEILRPEWATFPPLAVERGAILNEANAGVPNGRDEPAATTKGARRILRHPFAPTFHVLDRKARHEAWPSEGPTIVVLGEPFGVFPTSVPVDRRFGGGGATVLAVGGELSPGALKRFRTAYGAGVTQRDVFDAVLALLHHPEYRRRYHEDLRRGVPRIPLLTPDALAALLDVPNAPPVGPGTAYGTGWLVPDAFEPGVLPDYDDPFASPYARADVDTGFLLLGGLGAALYRLRIDFERLREYPLQRVETDSKAAKARLSADRTRLLGPGLTLEGIPAEASIDRIGRRSALEWTVEAHREVEPERLARLVGQAVAASLAVNRLVGILGTVPLELP